MTGGALREILVSFGFDFDKGEQANVLNAIEGVKHAALGLLAAFGGKEVVDFITETVSEVAELGDAAGETAQKIGVNAEELQLMSFLAKDAGASAEDLGMSLRVLSRNALETKKGSKELSADFERLGVRVTDSTGKLKPASDLLIELADSFSNVKDETERTALAQKVLGRSGTQMIPMLLKGSAAIREQMESAKALGFVIDNEMIEASDKLKTAQAEQAAAAKGLRLAFARQLIPVFTELAKATTKLYVKLQPLAQILGRGLAVAIKIIRKGLEPLVSFVSELATKFESLSSGITKAIEPAELLGAVLTGLFALLVAKAASMLLAFAPAAIAAALILAIAVAIGLVIDDLQKMGDGGDSAIGTLITGFQDMVKELGSIPAAIAEMLKTAIKYWIDFFSGVEGRGQEFIDNIMEKFHMIRDFWSKFSFTGGFQSSNPAGVTTSAATGGAPAAAGGAIVQGGNTNVEVKVDATGSSAQPADIGSTVTKHVEAAMERRDRELLQAVVVAAPARN